MKHIIIPITLIFITFHLFSQEISNDKLKSNNPFIRIEPNEVNLGTIPSNKVTEDLGNIEISLYNDGAKPLILYQVTACCGTRVSEYTLEPIPQNGKGTIKVSFRVATHPHRISRTVTVVSNAANGNSQRIRILGEVVIPTETKEIKLEQSSEVK